jgi:aminopeptidase-like protein
MDMYELDLAKATAADIILRSAVCHPTLFRDHLRGVAAVHRRSAREMCDRQARETAARMAQDCETMAQFAEAGWLHMQRGLDLGDITFGQRIQAFTVAAKLQLIPHSAATEIVSR